MTVTHTPQLDQRALALDTFPEELPDELLPDGSQGGALPNGAPAERERPSHLRVAPGVSKAVLRRRRRARYAVLGVAAISAASMFVLVAFHVFAVQSAFQLDKLDRELAAQQREYSIQRAQVARASSPEAVAAAATRLGMVTALSPHILHVHGVGPDAQPSFPVLPKTPYAPLDTPHTGP